MFGHPADAPSVSARCSDESQQWGSVIFKRSWSWHGGCSSEELSRPRDDANVESAGPLRTNDQQKEQDMTTITWENAKLYNQSGITLEMIAFDSNDNAWCVANGGQLYKWHEDHWDQQPNSWTLASIAVIENQLFGVGALGNIGVMPAIHQTPGQWLNMNNLGGWTNRMIVDQGPTAIWVVGQGNNLGTLNMDQTNSTTIAFTPPPSGHPGGWAVLWVAPDPTNQQQLYIVGTGNNLGLFNTDSHSFTEVTTNWALNMITSNNQGVLYCVGTDGNVGVQSSTV